MCRKCELRGKTWKGDDPVCGFDINGLLISLDDNSIFGGVLDNWNCATLNELRNIFYRLLEEKSETYHFEKLQYRYMYHEDEHYILCNFDNTVFVMNWYKNRGKTHYIKFFDNNFNTTELDYYPIYTHEDYFNELIKYVEDNIL